MLQKKYISYTWTDFAILLSFIPVNRNDKISYQASSRRAIIPPGFCNEMYMVIHWNVFDLFL